MVQVTDALNPFRPLIFEPRHDNPINRSLYANRFTALWPLSWEGGRALPICQQAGEDESGEVSRRVPLAVQCGSLDY